MKNILFIVMVMTFLSCSNELDEKVYSEITEQTYNYTEKDFYPTISAVYSYLREYPDYWGYFSTQEITADAIVMPPNASGWDDSGVYRRMHYHTWNSEQAQVSSIWSWFYRGALLCNKIIEQIQEGVLPAPSEDEKIKGLAEIRAMRAFFYWQICDNFGDAPLVTKSTMDLPEKVSRIDIYKFVESELLEVIPDLTEDSGEKVYGKMTKWSAKALLANLYLNSVVYIGTERWDDCITQCDDIINSGKFQLESDYKSLFKSQGVENSREIIWTIPFDEKFGLGNILWRISWHGELKKAYGTEVSPWGAGSAKGITQFINTYNENDSRLYDTWLMGQQFSIDGDPLYGTYDKHGEYLIFTKDIPSGNYTNEMEGYRMKKYEVESGCIGNSTTDIPIYRYSEILLMKAECMLRLNIPGAGSLVTEVRKRAFKDNPELAVVSDDELKGNSSYAYGYVENYEIVDKGNTEPIKFGRMYDELGWEFAWEMHRRRDAIRFGVYTSKSWLSHKPQGDYRTVFPIPKDVLISNPNLEQNPSYK